jgi:hypothetical protein
LTVLAICSTKCPATFLGVAAHVLMVPILPSSLNYLSTHDSISRLKNMLPGVGMANSRLKGQFPSNSYGVVVFRGLKLRLEGRLLGAMRTLHLSTSLTIVLCFSRLWVNLVYSFELTDYRFKKVENWARLSLVCRVTCSCAHPGSSSVGVFILLS